MENWSAGCQKGYARQGRQIQKRKEKLGLRNIKFEKKCVLNIKLFVVGSNISIQNFNTQQGI